MIISVSRRTDIPCFYMDWLMNRIRCGFADVRNPMNPHQVSRVKIAPDTVDALVFWSKNPVGLLRVWDQISFPFYVQMTLTAYGREVEPNLPDWHERADCFRSLAEKLGPGRMVWRYDPIFFSPVYTPDVHVRAFSEMAGCLRGFTDEVVISFLDWYPKMKKQMQPFKAECPSEQEQLALAERLARIAGENGMRITACSETLDLRPVGVQPGSCIDAGRLERLLGKSLHLKKDPSQRAACGCVKSVDIGAYNTCLVECRYCYANGGESLIARCRAQYDPQSSLLCGSLSPDDRVTLREKA